MLYFMPVALFLFSRIEPMNSSLNIFFYLSTLENWYICFFLLNVRAFEYDWNTENVAHWRQFKMSFFRDITWFKDILSAKSKKQKHLCNILLR